MDSRGWKFAIAIAPGPIGHIYPVDDLREHDISPDCWCKPTTGDDRHIYHHASDGRETLQ